MGLKNKVCLIRCKRPDDVIVIHPGPDAQSIANSLSGKATCGHPHLIVIGNPKFMRRGEIQPMPDEIGKHAVAAYTLYPVARVLVDTLAAQLGCAVDDKMVSDVLAHGRLLDVIHAAHEAVMARQAETPKVPIFGADGKVLPPA